MKITIITTQKVKVPDLDVDGSQKVQKGQPLFKEVDEKLEHEFEVHEHELVGSVANRFTEKKKLPAPPPGVKPTLAFERSEGFGAYNPETPMRVVFAKIHDLDGTKRFVLRGW
jgi:hypothetical protein